MNNQMNKESDPLRRFLGPDKIEKAPAGFTAKVMKNIRMEAAPAIRKGSFQRISTIPLISLMVTVSLIIITLLSPARKNDIYVRLITDSFSKIKTSLPVVDLNSIFNFNLPEVLIWVIAGLFILTIFDRALHGFFQKAK